MPRNSPEPTAVPLGPDRADGRAIHADREHTEKKDFESGHAQSLASWGTDTVKVGEVDREAAFTDEYPDGGLKAWTVVAGVSAPLY